MTKVGWFKLISLIAIVGVLIAICIIEDRLVINSLSEVKNYCYEIEIAVEKNDGIVNGEVASLVDNLEYSWKKHESDLCYMVNHKSIEVLGVEIVRLKTYINKEEDVEFLTSLEIIKDYVETFQHFMGASFHNIL
ncbi:MAG: DUF4363 family protein [Clostridia bacterium]|nr:DUF4363 family protein [Clostridia bacterium]